MAAYGGIEANQANVDFPFAQALTAARQLHDLAGVIDSKQEGRATEATNAEKDWTGPKHDHFRDVMGTENTDAATIVTELKTLSTKFCEQWAEARGEQDRINWARWVDSEISDDGYGENLVEGFTGEDDYGDPPGNPCAPSVDNDFAPTRDPIHPEFENRNV